MKLKTMRRCGGPLWLLLVALGFIFSAGIMAPDAARACHTKFTQFLKRMPVLTGGETMESNSITAPTGTGDTITVVATDEDVQICPSGNPTKMWTLGGDFPPPTVRVDTNDDANNIVPTKLKFVNKLGDGPGEIGHDDGVGVSGAQGLGGGTQTGVAGDHTEIGIHHHGSHVAPIGDGGACWYFIEREAINAANSSRTYTYFLRENDTANSTGGERGVSEWYHNHRVDVTGHTAWKGLAGGMFIIDDPADPRVSVPGGSTDPTGGSSSTSAGVIPRGPAISGPETYASTTTPVNKGYKFDVSLVIRDLDFDNNNQAPYVFDGQGSVGDHILVNGVPQPRFEVQARKYLFRVLVPGNSRKYFMRLVQEGSGGGGGGGGWGGRSRDSSPTLIDMIQVQSDGGFMQNAVARTEIPIGIAERVAYVIDFSQFSPGTSLILQNNDSASGQCVPHSCSTATSEIMRFDVVANVTADGPDATVEDGTFLRNIPQGVNPSAAFYIGDEIKSRAFRFSSEGQPFWTMVREDTDDIDGDPKDRIMDCRRYDADPFVNTVEKWTLHGVGNWTHSIHIHDIDQTCVSINGSTTGSGCQTFNKFKETWPMAPGVTFEVKLSPTDFTQQSAENNSAVGDPDDPSDPCRRLSGFAGTSGNCSENIFSGTSGVDTVPVAEPFYHGDTPTPAISSGVAPDNPANPIDGEAAGGRYMFHCHVLEHEDTGMMTHWRVRSGTPDNPTNVRSDEPCNPPGSCNPGSAGI